MKQIMGLRLACFSVLLVVLVFLLLETSISADGSAKFGSFKTGSAASDHHHQQQQQLSSSSAESGAGFLRGDKSTENGADDSVFGDQKRRIHTGPNPLHNR